MPQTTPHKILPLQLAEAQIQHLTQLHLALGEKLEQFGTLRPEMLSELRLAMKTVLDGQLSFPAIAESARDLQQIIHVTHQQPDVINLPWRLATEEFPLLFLTKGKPIEQDLPVLVADNPPLKILVMISSPEDSGYDTRLSYEEEETQIMKAFAPLFDSGQVQVDFTDDGSLENLTEKLAANRYHILHFSGHGVYQKDKGYLALEDPQTMNHRLVTAAEFAEVFQQKPEHMPTLVVLSSCQTAKGQLEKGMQSVADELLLKRLPAVIAMSVSVTDYFATYFSSALYQQLAEKEPLHRAYQKAIAQTRQHEQEKIPNLLPSQWMIPQLFVSQQIEQPVDWDKADKNLKYAAWKFVSGKEGLQTQKKKNYQFVGRRRDRKRIFQSLAKNSSVLLKGQGGVGKTAMAEYILQRLVAKDQQVRPFIFNETNAKLDTVLNALKSFLEERNLDEIALDAEEKYGDHAFNQFRFLFGQVKKISTPVFIFDNLETFQSAEGKALKPEHVDLKELLEFFYKRETPLILTCRYSVAECPDIPTFDLNQVGRNDFLKKALQMSLQELPKKIRQQGLSHLVEERLTFREVIGWLHETFGGNYRALEFFDELYAKKKDKLSEALKTLAAFKQEYAQATEDTRQRMSQNLLFEDLLKLLDADEKTALRLLSRFRIPVLTTALQMQRHDLDYPQLLESLRELTLLERHVDLENAELIFYYVTPLVKDLTAGAFGGDIDFSAEQAGRYHWWIFKENYNKVPDLEQAFHFFVIEENEKFISIVGQTICLLNYQLSQFQKVLHSGLIIFNLKTIKPSFELLTILGSSLEILGNWKDALTFFRKKREKAHSEGNTSEHISALSNISLIYRNQGNFEDALTYSKLALQLSQEDDNKELEITILSDISKILFFYAKYESAVNYINQALEISRKIQNTTTEYIAINTLAQIFKAQGDYKKSLKYSNEALNLVKETGNRRGESSILNNIGEIYKIIGDYSESLNFLKKSLKVCEEIEYKLGKVICLNNIGQLYQNIGKYDKALEYFKYALVINRMIGDRKGEGITLVSISFIFFHQGDFDTTLNYLQMALIIQKDIGDLKEEGTTLNNIGEVFKAKKDYENALNYLLQSLHISKKIGDRSGEGNTLSNVGTIYYAKGDNQTALRYLEHSLLIMEEIGEKNGESQVLHGIALIAKSNKDFRDYLNYETKAYQIALSIGNAYNIYRFGIDLGVFMCQSGMIEDGLSILNRSLEISEKNNLPDTKYIISAIHHFKNQQHG